jgi:hypothetical protein
MSEKINWNNLSAAILGSTIIGLSSCGYTERAQGPNSTTLEKAPTVVKLPPENSTTRIKVPSIKSNTQFKKLPTLDGNWNCNQHLLNFPYSYSKDKTEIINPINQEEGNKKTVQCLLNKRLLTIKNKNNPEKIIEALTSIYKRNENTKSIKCEDYLTTFTQSLCIYRWQKINFPKVGVTNSPSGYVGPVTKKAAIKLGMKVHELYDIGG